MTGQQRQRPAQDAGTPAAGRAALASRIGADAANALSVACDIWLLLSADGVILAAEATGADLPGDLVGDFTGKPVTETLLPDSHPKAAFLMHADPANDATWRELNHVAALRQGPVAIRYRAVALDDGSFLWVGKDHGQATALHGWMLQAQQDMEREQAALRTTLQTTQSVLAHIPQAVVVVDPGNRRIEQANQAAQAILGQRSGVKPGEFLARYFDRDSADALGEIISEAVLGQSASGALVLAGGGASITLEAVAVRTARSTRVLLTLSSGPGTNPGDDPWSRVVRALPDALAVVDRNLAITAVNPAFLDLSGYPSRAAALGVGLGDVLGRTGIEMSVLHANLREHGAVQNFTTLMRSLSGRAVEVAISAVAVPGNQDGQAWALLIRPHLSAPPRMLPPSGDPIPVQGLATDYTALIGRQSLKDIVRDTADDIERRCIERALEMTGNNRASAAELLGLSRQSLYTKLHRYGLASGEEDA